MPIADTAAKGVVTPTVNLSPIAPILLKACSILPPVCSAVCWKLRNSASACPLFTVISTPICS
ncbi:hypothetical protein P4I97_31145 [Bacillus cereus]|nr:hypothetical protein [Bacillus cereus]MED2511131.1 hypothetical protein [Bacillus thuringiensis]MEB9230371.1 hypothetical protein [Bacillus cereus]MEB9234862.1 hypothetical protein [Bacillus cereus]MEB9343905.1 hypothetical protein [Bacillus cereus]